MRLTITFFLLGLCLFACFPAEKEELILPTDAAFISRGQQLVQGLASCGYCHGKSRDPLAGLSGGREMVDGYGVVSAPNLTPDSSGLKDWTINEIMAAVRSSQGREGENLSADLHRGYEWLSDVDLLSIIAYLRSLEPVQSTIDRRQLSFTARNTSGLFRKDAAFVGGLVPEINRKHEEAYGKYLVDHVARCGRCHNSKSGIFTDSDYLAGGTVVNQKGESVAAPPIFGAGEGGLADWSESQIVKYLKDTRVSEKHCPVEFYARAELLDLKAIAKYLKTVEPE